MDKDRAGQSIDALQSAVTVQMIEIHGWESFTEVTRKGTNELPALVWLLISTPRRPVSQSATSSTLMP